MAEDWEEEYGKDELKRDRIRRDNEELLAAFEESLSGLSEKTIRKHLDNVGFYINEYLLEDEDDILTAAEGVSHVGVFLGYFLICKYMWSSPTSVKSTAASLKKFYRFMADKGLVSAEDYRFLCENIKENMEDWQEESRGSDYGWRNRFF